MTEFLIHVHAHPNFAKLIIAEIFRTGRHWQEPIKLIRDDSMGVFAEDFVSKAAVLPGLSDYVVWWKEPVFAAGLARSRRAPRRARPGAGRPWPGGRARSGAGCPSVES